MMVFRSSKVLDRCMKTFEIRRSGMPPTRERLKHWKFHWEKLNVVVDLKPRSSSLVFECNHTILYSEQLLSTRLISPQLQIYCTVFYRSISNVQCTRGFPKNVHCRIICQLDIWTWAFEMHSVVVEERNDTLTRKCCDGIIYLSDLCSDFRFFSHFQKDLRYSLNLTSIACFGRT